MFMGPIYGHKPAMARPDERRRGVGYQYCVLSTYIPLELGGAGKLALDQGGGHKTARIIIVTVI